MNNINRAVETYDHLLWEAIIRVCGIALSRSFHQYGNEVRVVYGVCPLDPTSQGSASVDPRREFLQIETEVVRMISLSLPIRKLGLEFREVVAANNLCSSPSYRKFFNDKIVYYKPGIGEGYSLIKGSDGFLVPCFKCDFVEIGAQDQDGHICCPCVGKHLENTRDLSGFKVSLDKPERVGKDVYEFRFEISERSAM